MSYETTSTLYGRRADDEPPEASFHRETLPAAPKTLDDTGLSPSFLQDLVLKIMHYSDRPTAAHIAEVACLPTFLVMSIVDVLKHQDLCEVIGSPDYTTPADYRYRLTQKGDVRSGDAMDRCRYAGAAPVPMAQYEKVTALQNLDDWRPSDEAVKVIFQSLVMDEAVRDRLTRALRSGRCTMVFGASGNGKSHLLGEFIGNLDGEITIPYSIYAHGQIIRVFDPKSHERVWPDEPAPLAETTGPSVLNSRKAREESVDRRWVRIKRPGIIVGGEVGAEALELGYDPVTRFYQAPTHLKAQGGVLVVDDFGRQKVSPAELLNRWIMPLERGRDLLLLRTGEAVEIPFHVTLLFSTNLNPEDLADSAYLRRILYKVYIPTCRRDQFVEIMRRACRGYAVGCDDEGLVAVASFVEAVRRGGLSGALARDLVSIVAENSRQEDVTPELSVPAIELAYQQFTGIPNREFLGSASAGWEEEVAAPDPYLA